MIIDLRGTNGSGKTSIVQKFVIQSIEIEGGYLYQDRLFILGPYYDDTGNFLSTGGCDKLTSDEIEELIHKYRHKYDILLEGADVSTSYKRWEKIAIDIGFHDYIFIFLNTSLDVCIKNKEERKKKFNRTRTGNNTNLVNKFHACSIVESYLKKKGYQTYNIDNKLGYAFIKQALDTNFVKQALYLSGGGKRSGTRDFGLYCSINRPEFKDLYYIRDSVKRLNQFQGDFTNKTVIDIGSNIGALSFEIINRKAKNVIGYEYNPERVLFCNRYSFDNSLPAKFYQLDLNADTIDQSAQIILCCSVDDYIENVDEFYHNLASITEETLLLECNIKTDVSVEDTIHRLGCHGFSKINFLGSGDAGKVSKKRKIYKCQK